MMMMMMMVTPVWSSMGQFKKSQTTCNSWHWVWLADNFCFVPVLFDSAILLHFLSIVHLPATWRTWLLWLTNLEEFLNFPHSQLAKLFSYIQSISWYQCHPLNPCLFSPLFCLHKQIAFVVAFLLIQIVYLWMGPSGSCVLCYCHTSVYMLTVNGAVAQ